MKTQSLAGLIYQRLDDIEQQLLVGITQEKIVADLQAAGIAVDLSYFRNALYRAREKRQAVLAGNPPKRGRKKKLRLGDVDKPNKGTGNTTKPDPAITKDSKETENSENQKKGSEEQAGKNEDDGTTLGFFSKDVNSEEQAERTSKYIQDANPFKI